MEWEMHILSTRACVWKEISKLNNMYSMWSYSCSTLLDLRSRKWSPPLREAESPIQFRRLALSLSVSFWHGAKSNSRSFHSSATDWKLYIQSIQNLKLYFSPHTWAKQYAPHMVWTGLEPLNTLYARDRHTTHLKVFEKLFELSTTTWNSSGIKFMVKGQICMLKVFCRHSLPRSCSVQKNTGLLVVRFCH